MNEWRIKPRVLFVALVPAVIITVLLTVFYAITRINDIDSELNARGQAIVRQLAPACEYGVFSRNETILVSLTQSALKEYDVVSAMVLDKYGYILAESRQRSFEKNVQNASRLFTAPILASEVEIDDFPVFANPFDSDGLSNEIGLENLGWVLVELTDEYAATRQQQIFIQSMLLSFIGLILTSLLAVRIAKGVTDPILHLAAKMEKIKSGNLNTSIELSSGGELGVLERGINTMVSSLKKLRDREMKRAEDELFLVREKAQVTLQCIGEGVITTDAKARVAYLNTAAEQLTGWCNHAAQGAKITQVLNFIDDENVEPVELTIQRSLKSGNTIHRNSHHTLTRRDGKQCDVRHSVAPIRDRDGVVTGSVLVFHDVTEVRRMAKEISYQAAHDVLTGLLNRREFEKCLQEALDSSRQDGCNHVLCYLDLDQFKVVNDTCGHLAGDELLKQLAMRFHAHVRERDILARLGGDEFGVILENCSLAQSLMIVETLRETVSNFRFSWQEHSFEVGVSVGVVEISADSGTLVDVLSAADSACYVAKDLGRNRIHIYRRHDEALMKRHGEMMWVHRLKKGFEEDNLLLFCQGIYPLEVSADQHGSFYEITVMMKNEEGGELVPPMAFIPAAERYHLMPDLDRWVIASAFRQISNSKYMRRYGEKGGDTFAINLSGQTLCDPHFLQFVTKQFEYTGLYPDMICFEITETAAISNLTRATDMLSALKAMGCRFALDDFGSGLSSFGYLKQLPVSFLKIDGGFVKGVVNDPVDFQMVKAINQIGHVMGLITIAECVESKEVMEQLVNISVDYGQGFQLGRPVLLSSVLE